MDTNLLRTWLDLPPGSWPPDDRALLGLSADPVDAAEAERKALTLMGRLRPHQLVHPELVTEGMNRIAQALLAVMATAPAAPRPAPVSTRSVAYRADLDPPAPLESLKPEPIAPVPLEPGGVGESVIVEEPATARPSSPIVESRKRLPAPQPFPLQTPAVEPSPEAVGSSQEQRRAAYRELAGLRSLLRSWDRFRFTIADPSIALSTPGEVFEFLEGIHAAREAAIHPGFDPRTVSEAAPVVMALVRQPLPLAVFRSLVPSQRHVLARDWAAARLQFVTRMAALRAGLIRATTHRPRVTWAGLVHTMRRNPEWSLVVVSGVLLGVAAVRLAVR